MSESPNLTYFIGDFEVLTGLVSRLNRLVVADFCNNYFNECKQMAAVFAGIAREFPKVVFIKINISDNKDLAEKFNITEVPHIKFFRSNENKEIVEISSLQGMNADLLRELCQKYCF